MARKTWLRMLSEHPNSHLIVARPAETDAREMARLLDRLVDRMQPRGSYATTLMIVKGNEGIHCAFEHEREAARMAGTMQARAISRYVGWRTQLAFDLDPVLAEMRKIPINDFMTKNGSIRPDGRVIRDMYLMQAKTPEESKGEWDLVKMVATVPGSEAFRPLNEGGCPLAANR